MKDINKLEQALEDFLKYDELIKSGSGGFQIQRYYCLRSDARKIIESFYNGE